MKRPRLVDAGLALAFFLVALAFRTLPGARDVLVDGGVRFRTADSLYHMRIVDRMVESFPRPVLHDPLLLWPSGMELPSAPFFDYLVAASALVLGRGSASPHLVDLCGAFLPPLLGSLLAALTWLLGRRPFGREGAALSAALVAVLPSQVLRRSVLGYADHHSAELLFLGLFLLLLYRSLGEEDETASARDATRAGIALALLALAWPWGAAFAAAALPWCLFDGAVRQGSRAPARLARAGLVASAPVLLASAAFPVLVRASLLLAAVGATALLASVACRSSRRPAARLLAPLAIVAALVLLAALRPDLVRDGLARLLPSGTARTVAESAPLLRTGPGLQPVFRQFSTGVFSALLGAGLAVRSLRSRPQNGLLLTLFAVTAALTLIRVRFSGEAAIVAVLLAGLVPGSLVDALRRASPRRAAAAPRLVTAALGLLLVVPAALGVPSAVRKIPLAQDSGWEAAMTFLRDSTPDPLPNSRSGAGAAWSVLSWWDNGWTIARLGRRVPVTNPTQAGAAWAARALLSEDEAGALALLAEKKVAVIALDAALLDYSPPGFPFPAGQFGTLPVWAKADLARYRVGVSFPSREGPRRSTFFLPPYFRTLAFRLWRHGGAAASPAGPVLGVRLDSRGVARDALRFPTYEAGRAFVASAGAGWSLASDDAYATCVPLEAWPRFRRTFSSDTDAIWRPGDRVARVQLFTVHP